MKKENAVLEFYASCPRGLSEVLEAELLSFDIGPVSRDMGGVFFRGDWSTCYRVNLRSRIASRILFPIGEFEAGGAEEIYGEISKINFTRYISARQTLAVDASTRDCELRDQRLLAMKTKDAIVDQFRSEYGERPNVEKDDPDLRIFIRGVENRYSVALDTSGDSLFKRGYRMQTGEAPLKENVAAALIAISEWDKKSPLVDPFCGSGTILIEAAMAARNISPGTMRKRFGFQAWKTYVESAFEAELELCLEQENNDIMVPIFGYDVMSNAVKTARYNAVQAGVDDTIQFDRQPIETLAAPIENGMIVTNPPYGIRIGEEDALLDVYRDFAHTLKSNFKGWSAWVLAGNKDLTPALKLKATRRAQVWNGPIECRFLKYEIKT